MKPILALLMFLGAHAAEAKQPEIWWAIRAECNVFMGYTSVRLNERSVDDINRKFDGGGAINYDTFDFYECQNDDDSILCAGTSQARLPVKFKIDRREDGTFKGVLNYGSQTQTLGCVLNR